MTNALKVLLSGLAIVASSLAQGSPQEALPVSKTMDGVEMALWGRYFIDSQDLSVSAASRSPHRYTEQAASTTGHFGPKAEKNALFARYVLHNPTTEPIEVVMQHRWDTVHAIDLVIQYPGLEQRRSLSRDHSLDQRDYGYRLLHASLELLPGTTVVYAKITGADFLKGNIDLWTTRVFQDYVLQETMLMSALVSVVGVFVISFFIMWATTREVVFLWPAVVFFTFLTFNAHFSNFYLYVLDLLDIPYYDPSLFIMLSPHLCLYSVAQFTSNFYDLRHSSPKLHRLFVWVSRLMLVFWLLVGLSNSRLLNTSLILLGNLITMIPVFICAFWMVLKGYRPAYYNLGGWLLLCLGNALAVSAILGFTDKFLQSDKGLLFGSAGLATCLALALGDRINLINRDRIKILGSQQALQASLEAASLVQNRFLARDKIPGFSLASYYHTADIVGGDWYSFHERNNWGLFFIGDVTGHGLSSALMTGSVAGAIKSYMNDEHSSCEPQEFLLRLASNLNRVIIDCNSDDDAILLTMAVVMVDRVEDKAYYLNAGHPGLMLLQDQSIKPMIIPGSPMGFRKDPKFRVSQFTFSPGSVIFMYTDGLTENSSAEGQVLTTRAIGKLLSCEASIQDKAQKIKEAIQSVSEGHPAEDDCTFVLIERLDNDHSQILEISAA
ncbi:SpoIIE family protein phosphatase [Pseudobacteriovorax antillogorgiicola]|uniref:Serine phosphatase RsbU, regulator of sigma subunit n=1 Tax=Pseudobacteriovorax antillogorgiicola TaxID=1513793 RepID=A0A1Y6BCY7_9BACT|nr:SpoIIE family protein phosphatase [Pseudobacteriovorax antillogorgiicola]TCS56472.1 serine phosphatase RsbU (regulator of sigma subunit) [Pseudobacteriovorax antillogorgiicola]SMF05077.1 Serine phosphatase RsbU, regulator of sigma subunit [Pseudobacteriovorax antillogorgiicola]